MSFLIEWWWAPLLNQCSWLWREGRGWGRWFWSTKLALEATWRQPSRSTDPSCCPSLRGSAWLAPPPPGGGPAPPPPPPCTPPSPPPPPPSSPPPGGEELRGGKDANCRHLESPFQGQVLPVRQWGEQDGPCLFHLIKAEKHHGKHHSERIVGAWNASYSYKWMQITFQLAWSDAIGADVDGEGQMNDFKRGFWLIDSSQKP